MQDALRLNGFAVCTPAAMRPWTERRRIKGAQTKNRAAHLELPDFERSGLCSDARRADCSNPMFLPIPGLNNREYVKTAIEVCQHIIKGDIHQYRIDKVNGILVER